MLPPTSSRLAGIRRRILGWYATEHRDFPWRRTRDPYAVLVSEVMLQQTQASRVVQRFERFLERFPDAAELASAPEAAVLAEWSGLGYNRRALALRRTAAIVAGHGWPREVPALERLPGVGPYTARAVASLAFGVPVGVVDTNVRRWLVRRLGLDPAGPGASAAGLQRLSDALARAGGPASIADTAAWTHATMEFGAAVCRARAPRCRECPVARGCPSRNRATRVPVALQPAFAGSRRAARGAVLRVLAGRPGHVARVEELAAVLVELDGAQLDGALEALVRDGLAHRVGEQVHLGPASRPGEVGTIGG